MAIIKPITKQSGVVLIVALVFLVALTAVASILMLNTSSDIKLSGASEINSVATQEAISNIDELIDKQVNYNVGGRNDFAMPLVTFTTQLNCDGKIEGDKCVTGTLSATKKNVSSAVIGLPDKDFTLETDCPHSRKASSTQVFTCNVLKVNIAKKYGRKNISSIEVNSGITQELLR